MNAVAAFRLPVLPEIVLGGRRHGAADVRRLPRRARRHAVDGSPSLLLVAAGVVVAMLPDRHARFGGSFVVDDFARFLKILALTGSAFAILMSLDYQARERQQQIRVSGADPALDHRHAAC